MRAYSVVGRGRKGEVQRALQTRVVHHHVCALAASCQRLFRSSCLIAPPYCCNDCTCSVVPPHRQGGLYVLCLTDVLHCCGGGVVNSSSQ